MPRVLGKALAIGGAALGAIATFLPAYGDFDGGSVTYWTFNRRFDAVTLVVLVAVVALGVISIVRPMRGVNIALAAASRRAGGGGGTRLGGRVGLRPPELSPRAPAGPRAARRWASSSWDSPG